MSSSFHQPPEVIFSGDGNQGSQVGHNSGNIQNYFNSTTHTSPPKCKPFSTVPFRRDPDFVDRGNILSRITKELSEPAARVALVGIGGIGKSQLAIEYSYRVCDPSPGPFVFWIHASSQSRFEEGYKGIADRLELPQRNEPKINTLELVYNWLVDKGNGTWVLIIDNADDPSVFDPRLRKRPSREPNSSPEPKQPLADLLPQSSNGTILVTSRNRDAACRLTGDMRYVIEVAAMNPAESFDLLSKKLPDAQDNPDSRDLLEALGFIPLAITQAAAYISHRAPRSSVSSYLKELQSNEEKKTRLLKHDPGNLYLDGSSSSSILLTWQISFDYIRHHRPSSADLLSLMCFFNCQGIPDYLLLYYRTEFSGNTTANENELHEDLPGRSEVQLSSVNSATSSPKRFSKVRSCFKHLSRNHRHGRHSASTRTNVPNTQELGADDSGAMVTPQDTDDANNSNFEDDLDLLRDFSLVTTNADGTTLQMHPLVQFSTKAWLQHLNETARWYEKLWMILVREFPDGEFENWEKCKTLSPHVEINAEPPFQKDAVINSAIVLLRFSSYLCEQGDYARSEDVGRKALGTFRKTLGEDHRNTIASMSNLANVLHVQGNYEEAEQLYRQTLEKQKRTLGEDHLNTLASISNLANVLYNQGNYEEAEQLHRQALKKSKRTLGEDHPNTLASMSNLANVLYNQGNYEEAEQLYRQTLEKRKRTLGEDHPTTLNSMNNIALVLRDQGNYEEAEQLYRQTLQKRKRTLGEDHPNTLQSMNNLALVLRIQGNYEEAEQLHRQTLEKRKRTLGEDHPYTFNSMNNLACVLKDQGNYDEVEQIEHQTLEKRKRILGENSPCILINLYNLGRTLRFQEKYEAAEEMFRQALEGEEKVLGKGHPDTKATERCLIWTLEAQGKSTAAAELDPDRENSFYEELPGVLGTESIDEALEKFRALSRADQLALIPRHL